MTRRRVYQQITLVYDLHDDGDKDEDQWITWVADSIRHHLKAFHNGVLSRQVVEVQIGAHEVETISEAAH